jgi:nitrogen fixation protein FixH
MTDAATPQTGFRLNGWHVLAIISGFFAVVIAVDVGFVVMAVKTFPGEVSRTPYEDGLAYDKSVAQQRAQARMGWRATAAAEPAAVGVEMRDRNDAPITGLTVTGMLERPATEAGRLALRFRETRPGRYVARLNDLSGAWDLSLQTTSPKGELFTAHRRLSWP